MTNGMAVQLLIGMVIKRGSGPTAGLLKWSNATAGKAGRGRWDSGGEAAERIERIGHRGRGALRCAGGRGCGCGCGLAGASRSNEGMVKRDGGAIGRWSSGTMAMARGDGVA